MSRNYANLYLCEFRVTIQDGGSSIGHALWLGVGRLLTQGVKLHIGGVLVSFLQDVPQAVLSARTVGEQARLVARWVRLSFLVERSKWGGDSLP